MKTCIDCREEKPLADFYKKTNSADRLSAYCKVCCKEHNRKNHLKRTYQLSANDYSAMMTDQSGVCAICDKVDDTDRSLAVDHCHKTGKVRGLLCHKCNTALGLFKDDVKLFVNAISYLSVT